MYANAGSLRNDGMVLEGYDLERYSKRKGLCSICARFQTHKRVGKLMKRNQWEPLTVKNEQTGDYQVYKGYCTQPTCYTLDQAKELLGEKCSASIVPSTSRGDGSINSKQRRLERPPKAQNRIPPDVRPSLSVTCERQPSQMSRLTSSSMSLEIPSSPRDSSPLSVRTTRSKSSHKWSRDLPEIEVPITSISNPSDKVIQESEGNDVSKISEDSPGQKQNDQSAKKGIWKKILTGHPLKVSDKSTDCAEPHDEKQLENHMKHSLVEETCTTDSDTSLDGSVEADKSSITNIHAVCLKSESLGYLDIEMVALHEDDIHQRWLSHECLQDESDQSENGVKFMFYFEKTPLVRLYQNFSNNMEELELEANLRQYDDYDELPTFETRAALEAEITSCKAAIEGAGTSDDPIDIQQGIKSRKRLPRLISLRADYLSKQELEDKIKRLSMSMGKIRTKDLNKRLAVAKDRAVLVDQLKAEITEEQEQLQLPEEMSQEESLGSGEGVANHSIPIGCSINVTDEHGNGSRSDISELDASYQSNSYLSTQTIIQGHLTVFQSAPLAYVDPKTTIHHICPLIDFDYEARALRDSVKDTGAPGAKIDVQIEIATIDRLSAFLANSNNRIMHLSCHGHPNSLALENGHGTMQVMPAADLKRFIASSTVSLEIVFVSSRYPLVAGNAFLEAGIRHVVCCRQDDEFRDEAVVGFTHHFYRSLSLNNNLKQAFRMAREAIRVSNTTNESTVDDHKYILLPEKADEDPYHDVTVFSKATTGSIAPLSPVKEEPVAKIKFQRLFPRVPPFFVGREIDMFTILEGIRSNDVVCIRGQPKVGKTSLVAATIRYIERRQSAFQFDDIMWLPAQESAVSKDDTLYFSLARMIYLMTQATQSPFHLDGAYTVCWARIAQQLKRDKQLLLVIHGKNFASKHSVLSLEYFLKEMLQVTNVKVILVGFHDTYNGSGFAGGHCVDVAPLEFEPTVQLFARLCQSVCYSSRSIVKSTKPLLDVSRSWCRTKIYTSMGSGIPSEIRRAALEMTDEELSNLLIFTTRPKLNIHCRAQADEDIELKKEEEAVELQKNFKLAQEIRDTIDELESLRQNFPSLEDLYEEEKSLKLAIEHAIASRNYDGAGTFQDDLTGLQTKISRELQWQEQAELRRLPSF